MNNTRQAPSHGGTCRGFFAPATRPRALIMLPVRIIAVTNQKGGVAKTTTVANIGAAIAARGHHVCLIDLDPQAHLTMHLGAEPRNPRTSVYDVLVADAPLAAATLQVAERLWLVPSVIDLAAAETELVSVVGREQILRDRLGGLPDHYEFVFIDCPPSLGLLTLNALAAAHEVVIPLQPHFLALQGLGKLLETVSLVRQRINPGLRVSGVMLCMYESSTRLASEVVADLRNFLDAARDTDAPWAGARIFDTVVRRNIKLAECPSHGLTIFDYEPNSNGARDYLALTEEFLAHGGAAPPVESPRPEQQTSAGAAPAASAAAEHGAAWQAAGEQTNIEQPDAEGRRVDAGSSPEAAQQPSSGPTPDHIRQGQ